MTSQTKNLTPMDLLQINLRQQPPREMQPPQTEQLLDPEGQQRQAHKIMDKVKVKNHNSPTNRHRIKPVRMVLKPHNKIIHPVQLATIMLVSILEKLISLFNYRQIPWQRYLWLGKIRATYTNRRKGKYYFYARFLSFVFRWPLKSSKKIKSMIKKTLNESQGKSKY